MGCTLKYAGGILAGQEFELEDVEPPLRTIVDNEYFAQDGTIILHTHAVAFTYYRTKCENGAWLFQLRFIAESCSLWLH